MRRSRLPWAKALLWLLLGLKAAKTALEAGGLSSKELRDNISAAKDAMEGVRRVRELDDPDSHKFDPFAFIKVNRENELGA